MVARVRQPGSTPKLVNAWIGPRPISTLDKVHVNGVQNIVTGEVEDVNVVCLWFYADKGLEMTAALKEVFQHAFTQPPVLSTCPLHTNSGCGKERRILIGPW